jgi:hypothetical protein
MYLRPVDADLGDCGLSWALLQDGSSSVSAGSVWWVRRKQLPRLLRESSMTYPYGRLSLCKSGYTSRMTGSR